MSLNQKQNTSDEILAILHKNQTQPKAFPFKKNFSDVEKFPHISLKLFITAYFPKQIKFQRKRHSNVLTRPIKDVQS